MFALLGAPAGALEAVGVGVAGEGTHPPREDAQARDVAGKRGGVTLAGEREQRTGAAGRPAGRPLGVVGVVEGDRACCAAGEVGRLGPESLSDELCVGRGGLGG